MRSISILGATGSVGEQTLDLVRRNPAEWNVVALTANSNVAALAASAREFGAQVAVVADESRLGELRDALAGSGIEAAAGRGALCEAASRPVDMTVAAIVGCAGLGPVMAAIEQGGTIALANKEALVSAGEVMTAAVARHGATLLPVDSEHNAIFQVFESENAGDVEKLILTASGGPFRTRSRAQMAAATKAFEHVPKDELVALQDAEQRGGSCDCEACLLVLDVRDDDSGGGSIAGAVHQPDGTFDVEAVAQLAFSQAETPEALSELRFYARSRLGPQADMLHQSWGARTVDELDVDRLRHLSVLLLAQE